MLTRGPPPNACRMCGATSYRSVIAKGSSGEMRQGGLYQCSGCNVVFADPKAWRDSGIDAVETNAPSVPLLTPFRVAAAMPVSNSQTPPSGMLRTHTRSAP